MSGPSDTRRQLEASLRSFLPREIQSPSALSESKPTLASVGVGGLVTGYLWGRLRGRTVRKAKERSAHNKASS